ncbi:MAG: hypothetical protein FE78DRAFT_487056 [Acidomyces sp. 'richmondensis']|nr:MAG: hypothetical protein FE78DRAFT_487056 [Acidomyces sp. 'richmondensis']
MHTKEAHEIHCPLCLSIPEFPCLSVLLLRVMCLGYSRGSTGGTLCAHSQHSIIGSKHSGGPYGCFPSSSPANIRRSFASMVFVEVEVELCPVASPSPDAVRSCCVQLAALLTGSRRSSCSRQNDRNMSVCHCVPLANALSGIHVLFVPFAWLERHAYACLSDLCAFFAAMTPRKGINAKVILVHG